MERLKIYDNGLSTEKIEALRKEVAELDAVIDAVQLAGDTVVPLPGPRVITAPDTFLVIAPTRPNNDDLVTLNQNSMVRKIENVLPHKQYCESVRLLNDGQKTLVLEYIDRICYNKDRPMQIFLTGPAGTGKTTILKIIMETCNRFTQRHNMFRNGYVAAATTGKAAVALDANTIHTTFNISVNRSRRTLTGAAKQTMRLEFAEITLIIVDEISMASGEILNCINERLMCVGKDPTKIFGGFHVILCGDLRQLPPVMARPVYVRPANMLQDRMVWQQLRYYPITEVMRQIDARFSKMLTKIGNGDMLSDREIELMHSRFIDMDTAMNDPNLRTAVRLFFNNSDVDKYNYDTLINRFGRVIVDAEDEVLGNVTAFRTTDVLRSAHQMKMAETGQMVKSLVLVVGENYILTQNINNFDGIVNGAIGVLRHIENKPDTDKPHCLWIQFDRVATGALARLKYKQNARRLHLASNLTPILKRIATFSGGRTNRIRRAQFPIIPGGAMTIHKAQGGSFDKVIYGYEKTHEIALVHVALSRARSIEGLFLVNRKDDHKFYHYRKTNSRVEIATEFARVDKVRLKTIVECGHEFLQEAQEQNLTVIGYINVQSLHAHTSDIATNPVLRQTTIMAFSETWMDDQTQPVEIQGFKCISRFRRQNVQAGGVAIYKMIKARLTKCTHTHLDVLENVYGDATCARVQRFNREGNEIQSFHLVAMYAKTKITEQQLMQFFYKTLIRFNKRGHDFDFEDSLPLSHRPLIICGDINFDLASSHGARIVSFLREIHEVHLVQTLGVTTRFGTSIDAILYKQKLVESIPYVSYFSVHRPYFVRLTDTVCQVDEQPTELRRQSVTGNTYTKFSSRNEGEFELRLLSKYRCPWLYKRYIN